MSKNNVVETRRVTLDECALLIQHTGEEVTYFVEGEPGVGKTSLLAMRAMANGDRWRKVGDYFPEDSRQYIYVDCPLIDLPDFAMPYVENGQTHYAPSKLWGFDDARPKEIMFDEVSKAPNVVKPMFTRALLERCIGERYFPKGTRLFATGNMMTDGVGDTMQGHINNRVCRVRVGKPSSEAWIAWGIKNGVNENILVCVHQMPDLLQSYLDDPTGANPYIFNPKKNTGAFVSPRSLAKAGVIVDKREVFGHDLTLQALAGCLGTSAASQMVALLDVADSLPSWEAIEKNPLKTAIPKSAAAQLLLLFGSVSRLDKKNAEAYTAYFYRMDAELSALWARQFAAAGMLEKVMGVKLFRENLVQNSWIMP